MNKNILSVFFVLIFIMPSVLSATGFNLQGDSTQDNLCPTSTGLYTFIVTNTGDAISEYTISLSGSAGNFAVAAPSGFILQPGKSKTVYTYITPKSTTIPGLYDLGIAVTSETIVKTIEHKINVLDCHKAKLTAVQSMQSACPGNLVKYEFILENVGEYQETYSLELGGNLASKTKLSENSVKLEAGTSKTIYAYVENVFDVGTHEFTLTAKDGAIVSNTVKLEVQPCFDYTVTTDKDYYNQCENVVQKIPVTIKNIGTNTNSYKLTLNGPAWASLEHNELTLSSGQDIITNLILNPSYSVSGESDLLLKVVSDKSGVEAIKSLKINVDKCHSVYVDIVGTQDRICNTLSNTYEVIVKNDGKTAEDYSIGLNGPIWSSLDKSLVKLNPGQEEKLTLTVNPSIDAVTGVYPIVVEATTLDKGRTTSDTLNLEAVSRERCFEPSINVETSKIEAVSEESVTIPVTIKNEGTERATYILGLSGTASSFVQLNPSTITVEPNKAEVILLYVAPTKHIRLGDYSVTILAKLDDSTILDSKTLDINIVEAKTVTEITGQAVAGSSIWDKIVNYKVYTIVGLVVLLLLILIVKFAFKEDKEDLAEFEEKQEEEKKEEDFSELIKEDTKTDKTWIWWTLGLVGLGILGFLGWKYNVFSYIWAYLKAYKYYVLGGIFALALIGVIVKFTKKSEKENEEDELKLEEELLDEEEIPKSGKGKWIISSIIVALLAGLGYYFRTIIFDYKYYILSGIGIAIVFILAYKYRKPIIDFFEEEDLEESLEEEVVEEEPIVKKEEKKEVMQDNFEELLEEEFPEKGSKVWIWWTLGLVGLGILGFLGWKYNVFSYIWAYLKAYKYYVLGGIGGLALIILLIKFRAPILKFFEEDESVEEDLFKEEVKKEEPVKKEEKPKKKVAKKGSKKK